MSELPGLIVPIEARIDQLERSLKKASRAQNRAAGLMERRAQQSARRIGNSYSAMGESAAAAFTKKLLPVVAAVGSVQTVRQIADVTKSVAQLGDEAKRAGVNAEAFQEWRYVAEQNRIGVDQMVDGLKELNLRADEFVLTSKGPAAEAFARLGYTAGELREKLKNPSDLLLEIIGRMEELDAAARIRISDEIFGGSAGERFVELVGRGEGALRETIRAAHDTGAVLDDKLIEKADEIDRRFTALKSRSAAFFREMAVNAADAGLKLATLRTDLDDLFKSPQQAGGLLGADSAETLQNDSAAVEAHKEKIKALRAEYERLAEAADAQAAGMMQAAATLRGLGYDAVADQLFAASDNMRRLASQLEDGTISADEFETKLSETAETAQTALGEIDAIDRSSFSGVIAGIGGLITKLSEAAARARELRAELPGARADGTAEGRDYRGSGANPGNAYGASAVLPQAVTTSERPRLPSVDSSFGAPDPERAGGGGGRTQSDYERELSAIAEETAALRIEAQALADLTGAQMRHGDALELARTKADLLAAAMRSGRADTPALRAEVDQLATAYVRASHDVDLAADKIAEVQAASRAGAQSIADVFTGMATGALSAREAVMQLITQIMRLIIQKRILAMVEAMSGAGGIGGLVLGGLAGVLGGGFAAGGFTGRGGKHEPAGIVHRGEYVMSKAATTAIGVGNLEALHNAAKRGYSGGGLVGGDGRPKMPSAARTAPVRESVPQVSISAPITVNGSAGTPEQNDDLAKRMSREMENTMRGVVVTEIQRQMRPGNLMNNRRGR